MQEGRATCGLPHGTLSLEAFPAGLTAFAATTVILAERQ
jgi:hypothetical protein